MDIAVETVAAKSGRLGRVLEVEKDQTVVTLRFIEWASANSNTVFALLINDDIVGGADRKIGKMASKVILVGKLNGSILRGDFQKLRYLVSLFEIRVPVEMSYHVHIEDLNTVALEFTTDEHVVLVAANLLPPRKVAERSRSWASKAVSGDVCYRDWFHRTGRPMGKACPRARSR
jgi:hypothetical protein